MATKTYYVPSGADGNFGALVDGVAQTAASRADGWTVAKNASPLSSEFDVGVKNTTFSSNSTTPKPASFLTTTAANAWKIPASLAGIFDVGNWVFTFAVRATTASSQAGRIRMRVFAATNAAGTTGVRELTAATQVGTTSAALSTTADVTSVVTWAPGTTITVNNEFLFFVIAWEITTAGGANQADVVIRTGSTGPAGSALVTPNYTPNTLVSGTDSNGTTTESASITKVVVAASDSGGVPSGGAFPSTGVLDGFNRANGALGANWTGGLRPSIPTAPVISANAMVAGGTPGTISSAWWNQASFGPDCEVYANFAGITSPSLYARVQNPGASSVSGYVFMVQGATIGFIQSLTNDAATTLVGNFSIPANTTKMGLSVIGNTLTAWGYTNGAWAVITTRTDSTYSAAGYIGVSLGNSGGDTFDDFGGGTYVAAGGESATVFAPPTPVSSTDSGTATEAATVAVPVASSDTNGTVTEAAAISVVVADPTGGPYTSPPTAVLDSFNRADGAPGPNWTPALSVLEPLPALVGNRLVGSGGSNSSGYWNRATFGPDCEVYMSVAPSVTGEHDPIIRATSFNPSQVPNDGYLLQTFAAQVNLFRANGAGGLIQIGTAIGLAPFDGVWLVAIGSQITAYVRQAGVWNQQVQVIDATWPGAGFIGFLMGQDTAAYIDDFGGGNTIARVGGVVESAVAFVSDTDSGTATESASVAIAAGTPLLETLIDSFDASLNTAKWNDSSAGTVWDSGGGGRARIPLASGANAWLGTLWSNPASVYDLTGSFLSAAVTPYPYGQLTRTIEMAVVVANASLNSSVSFRILRQNQTGDTYLQAWRMVTGSSAAVGPQTTAWNSVSHAYLRIRESGGAIYWDTSPDGKTWTNWASQASFFAVTSVVARFTGSSSGSFAAGDAYVDSVNVVVTPVSSGDSGTATETASVSRATLSGSDAGSIAETLGSRTLSVADAGAGSDSASVIAPTWPTTGLVARLDAAGLGLADGATVSPWPNTGTPGIPGTMIGSPGPVYVANGLNGKGIVRFSAGAGRMRMTGTGITTPFTLLVVARTRAAGAGAQRVVTVSQPTNFLLGWWNNHQDTLYDGGWPAGEPSTAATPVWKLYSFDKTGTNPVRMFLNGLFLMNGGGGADMGGTLNLSGHDPSTTAETSDCDVAEVLLYNRVLSDAERQQAENYLRGKWFATPTNYPQAIQAGAPVGYWRLNETAGTTGADSSGYNNPVTFSGNPTLGVAGPLADGTLAISLDGVDDMATIPSGVVLPLNTGVTVEWWQYVATADVQPEYGFWLAPVGADATDRLSAHTPWSDRNLYWDHGGPGAGRLTADYTPYLDKWTLVQLTWDVGTQKQAITLNGTEVVSQTSAATPTIPKVGGVIGSQGAGGQFAKARYAEFALYNYALTPAQRVAHYQAGLSKSASVSDSNGATTEAAGLVITVAEPATYGTVMATYATYSAIPGSVATYRALAGSPFPQVTEATLPLVLTVYEPDQIGTYQAFQSTYAVSYTQLGVQFGSYAALQGGTLPLPNLVEAATVTQTFSGADSSGPVTETATVVARPADVDSGSGADTASLLAKATVADADGATTETAGSQVVLSATDASGATETQALAAKFSDVDSDGAVTETPLLVAKLAGTDADGAVTESGSAFAQITPISGTDASGATTEAQALVAALPVSDAGTDSESQGLATFNQVASSDTNGPVTESATTVATVSATDADGATTEGQGLVVVVASTDADGATVESAGTATFNQISGSDSATAADIASLVSQLAGADGGTSSEATAIRVAVIDSNGVVELATVVRFNPFALSDTGLTLTDTLTDSRARVLADTALALADAISRGMSAARLITDSGLTMTDSLTRAQALVRSLADTALTVADSLVRTTAGTKLLSDTGLVVADTIATTRARVLTDTAVALVESLALKRGITLTDTALGSLGSATDSFNRANGGLGSSWTTQSTDPNTLQISGNKVVASGGINNQATSIWNANSFGATQFSEARISDVVPNLNWVGVAVRVQSSGNAMYLLIAFNNAGTPVYQLYRRNGGSYTQVGATVNQALNIGDVFRLEVNGNTLTAKVNGATIINATDATIPSGGSPGIAIYTAAGGLGGSLDDWNAGYYGAPMADVLVPLRSAGLSDNGVVVSDSLVRKLVAPRALTDVGLTVADVVSPKGALVLLDTGLSMTDSLRQARLVALADTALTLADSLRRVAAPKPLVDSGLVMADMLTAQHLLKLADTALALSDTLRSGRPVALTDTGLSFAETLTRRLQATRPLTDIALSLADAVAPSSGRSPVVFDTALAMTDAIRLTRALLLQDTALSEADALSRRAAHPLADVGLAVAESLTLAGARTRTLTDTALTAGDVIAARAARVFADVALTTADLIKATLPLRLLSDTGLAATDALKVGLARKLADAALAQGDALRSAHPIGLSDAGLNMQTGFSPSDIAGLGVWLDASKITGLADGAPLPVWPDASGGGHDAVLADTPGPVYRAAGFNGHPAVEFSGATSGATRLRIPGLGTLLNGKTAYTLFYVLEADDYSGYPIINAAPIDTAWNFITEFDTQGGFYWGHANGTFREYRTAFAPGQKLLLSLHHVAGVQHFYSSGVEQMTYDIGPSGDTSPSVSDLGPDMMLGGYYYSAYGLLGRVCEMVWYDHALTDAERQQVEGYLNAKWFGAGVPTGHGDSITRVHALPRSLADAGLVLVDAMGSRKVNRMLADIGLTVIDVIPTQGQIPLLDAGLVMSDVLALVRAYPRAMADIGLSLGDSIALPFRFRARALTDSGIVVAEALPLHVTRAVADTGLTLIDLITKGTRPLAMHDTMPTLTDSLSLRAMRGLADVALGLLEDIGAGLPPQKLYDTGLAVADEVALTRASVLADVALALEDLIETAFTKASITDPTQFELATTQLLVVLAASSLAITLADGRRELVVDESVREVGLETNIGGREAELVLAK